MPTSSPSVRRTAPRQVTAKRRQSIAAFEQWQRNWSASLHRPGGFSRRGGRPKQCSRNTPTSISQRRIIRGAEPPHHVVVCRATLLKSLVHDVAARSATTCRRPSSDDA